MPVGTRYSYTYLHKRKEIVIQFQVGTAPPVEIIMGAEAFIQDIDYMSKDENIPKFLAIVRERKDLPIDYDFGEGGKQGDFNSKEWEDKMGGRDVST